MISNRNEKFTLSAETIDSVSAICVETLEAAGADRRDIIRIRLSLEEILGIWLDSLKDAPVHVDCGRKFGRDYLKISVEGPFMDAWEKDNEAYLITSRMLAQSGLSFSYAYKNGKNCLTCNPKKKSSGGQLAQLLTAVILAVVLGFGVRAVPAIQSLAPQITNPLFNLIFGAIRAVSSPLIFLSVCCGIVSIGDLSVVGKIGQKLIIRMIRGVFVLAAVMALIGCLLFPLSAGEAGEGVGNFSEIIQMVLGIVPSDIITPFLNGNGLQLVFLGICLGATLLILGERVSSVQSFLMQVNDIIQFLMGVLGKFVPIFVFLSLFNLMISDFDSGFMSLFRVFLLSIPGSILMALFYVSVAAVKLSASPILLIKKMLPTYLIALSTASSAAALSTNLETCEKELGIPGKVAVFAIPLGQVLYKPGYVLGLFAIVLCMAEFYGISITPQFLIMAVLCIGLLSMAAPPIPGGALSTFAVLFLQLGIPSESIALAVALSSVMDYFMTSSGLASLQVQVALAADSVGMLDRSRLKKLWS